LKAFIFDLDDTLYREMDFVRSGFRVVGEFLAGVSGRDPQWLCDRAIGILERDGRSRVFDTLLDVLDMQSELNVRTLLYLYRSHTPRIVLDASVPPCFAALREGGHRLGIITDGKASVQARKVEALGLRDKVDAIIYTDELGGEYSKPSTVPFELALRLLEVPASRGVYVGDNPAKDFLGPNRLGMTTVRIDKYRKATPQPEPIGMYRATFRIDELAELPAVLEEANP